MFKQKFTYLPIVCTLLLKQIPEQRNYNGMVESRSPMTSSDAETDSKPIIVIIIIIELHQII